MPTISIPDALKANFVSIDAARIAIQEFIINIGEFYRVTHANRTRHIVACRDTTCKFIIRASLLKGPKVRVTRYTLYSCSPFIHHRFQQANSIAFLKDWNRDAIVDNREITPAQIQSMERIRFGNARVSYQQAWRIREALLEESEGNEAEGFKKIPALMNFLIEADNRNYMDIAV
jgi:hypothetical protein